MLKGARCDYEKTNDLYFAAPLYAGIAARLPANAGQPRQYEALPQWLCAFAGAVIGVCP